jgi:hypothetical protein
MTSDSTTGTHYTICIREKLDDTWAEWFDPMSLRRDGECTVLVGWLPDQAALHGMLRKVNNLGLQLVAVMQSEPDGQ